MKNLKRLISTMLLAVAILGLCVYLAQPKDMVAYARSFGFTAEGAEAYAKAYAAAAKAHKCKPTIINWAAHNPEDVSLEERESSSEVGIIASRAMDDQLARSLAERDQ